MESFENAIGTTGYRTMGPADGPPVLLLHGLSLHGGMYEDIGVILADKGYRVVAMDFYGRGGSPWPWATVSDCSDGLLVQQAVDLLGHLGIPQVELLMGHSMGGGTAIALAARHPHLVKRLLTTSATGLPSEAGSSFAFGEPLNSLLPARFSLANKKNSTEWWVESGNAANIATGQADDFYTKAPLRMVHAQVGFAADNLMNHVDGFTNAYLSSLKSFPFGYGAPAGDTAHDYKQLGKTPSLPVTMIWGHEDATCPIKSGGAELVQKFVPHGKLVVQKNAGHAVIYEAAAKVKEELEAILASP